MGEQLWVGNWKNGGVWECSSIKDGVQMAVKVT